MAIRRFRLPLFAILLALLATGFDVQARPDDKNDGSVDQFIVQFVPGSTAQANSAARQRFLDAKGREDGVGVELVHRMAVGADVVHTNRKLDGRAAQAFMNRLRKDPNVKYVEIDKRMRPNFVPNDPLYASNQWHYFEAAGGINLPAAWDQSTGAGVVVAVLDTGITQHSDLNTNVVPGYDFIHVAADARDGDGRDPNPADEGDWELAGDCGTGSAASDSSWHGTHVAGTIAAVTNNGVGVAGVAFNAKIMPVRVLGRCGGYSSDISDAIIWAAGGAVAGVPTNPNPVQVINMSLGGTGACGAATQSAINFAVAAGVVVVVSAGNDNLDAAGAEPANCDNVIAVGATGRAGGRASYSNFGASVDVSAPGGSGTDSVASTFNNGKTIPTTEGYAGYKGTSMAAPHVSGTVALMQSAVVSSPAAVESILKNTARTLPVACPEGCGAGIINASAAIAGAVTGVLTVDDQSILEGDAGTTIVTFTVRLSKPMPAPVSFDIATANGTATAGSDYVGINLTGQSIPAGATSQTFAVAINGDTLPEADETFFVNVSNVVGIPVADGQGMGTIINDDPVPLSNGLVVDLSGSLRRSFLYSITVPAGTSTLTITTSGGTGDADLYVSFGTRPSTTVADCVSNGGTSDETCIFSPPSAGTYYILVYAYSTISNVSLLASYPGANIDPTAAFSYVPNGLNVNFTDASTDSDGTIAARSWTFGDGSISSEVNPVHVYAAAGTYTVGLTVTDNRGGTNSTSQPVRITAPTALLSTDQYLWMVPPASNTQQQGFVRLINRENRSGLVTVWGLDAFGRRSEGTISLTLAPLESRQFNSIDIESGNPAKGLTGSLGTGSGTWTLIVRTDLNMEPLAYIRTPDGFLTSMHDRVTGDGVDWFVPIFNPAENPNQVSHLRLINTNTSPVSLQINGTDDAGVAGFGPVTLTIAALSSADLTSVDLESGNSGKGLIGSLGNGAGKWRLAVSATGRITVQSLLYDPLGKLTNLSSIPDLTQPVVGQRTLWMVPPASNTQQQGFIRLVNLEARAGTVTLRGVDDAGQLSPGVASVTIGSKASVQFNSIDLESGNAAKGLTGSLGRGVGNWRLQITTDLNLVPLGLIRTPDGFLTTVHDTVSGDGLTGNVLIFNPAANPNQVSVLRLVNPTAGAVNVTIQGVDDAGVAGRGGAVSLTLAAGEGKELSATDLESGNAAKGLTGSLGSGSGKWRLSVTATAPIKVLSLLRDPRGYLTDLSTGAKGGSARLDP